MTVHLSIGQLRPLPVGGYSRGRVERRRIALAPRLLHADLPHPMIPLRPARGMLLAVFCSAAVMQAQARPVTRQAASVVGTVADSVTGRVLRGATVQLARDDGVQVWMRTALSDSLGRYRFTDVQTGRYVLSFLHPALDSLGLEPSPVNIVVSGATTRRADLAFPSAATLRVALCGDASLQDSIALIIGYVRRANGREPLDSAVVTVQWQPRTPAAAPGLPLQRRVAALPSGWFAVCGARSGDTIQLGASRIGAAATSLTLTIPASGLLHRDVLLRETSMDTVAAPVVRAVESFPVSGVVVDADSALFISGAIVAVSGGAATRSDTAGAWRLASVAGGTQTLTVRALRYAPQSVSISVAPNMPAVRLSLARLQGLLDTVNVVEDASTDRNHADFLARSRTRGSGTFLLEEDIAGRRATLTSDLFLTVQGGITIVRDSIGNRYITMRSNTFRSDRCKPAIFLDGMSMHGLTTADIDALVRPEQLFGIEVYRAANAPGEFSEQDGCGTILLWTKR